MLELVCMPARSWLADQHKLGHTFLLSQRSIGTCVISLADWLTRMSKLQPCASMAAELAKIWSMARGIIPLSSGVPSMVWVLPLPVCPYANMHTL